MRRATLVLGAATVLFATAASAQEKPNFSGKWQLDQEKTQAANSNAQPPGGGGGGGGGRGFGGMGMGPFTLVVDEASLTRESEGQNGAMKLVYKLDGSEQTLTMGQAQVTAKAKWEGNTIVIESTRQGQNGPVATKSVYSVEADHLVIEQTSPRGTTKRYYKKAT